MRYKNFKKYRNDEYYDVIMASQELKKLLLKRCEELGVSIYSVCVKSGITWNVFKTNYLNRTDSFSTPYLRQDKVMKVFETVGIKIKYRAIVSDVDAEVLKELKEMKFLKSGARNEKKRTTK